MLIHSCLSYSWHTALPVHCYPFVLLRIMCLRQERGIPLFELWFRCHAVVATGKLTSVDASATLRGCARLGIQPPEEVIAACWQAVMRDGSQHTQTTANIAWSLALLGVSLPSYDGVENMCCWVHIMRFGTSGCMLSSSTEVSCHAS